MSVVELHSQPSFLLHGALSRHGLLSILTRRHHTQFMSLLFTRYVRSSIAGDVSRAIRRRICDPCRRLASSNVARITLDSKPSGQTEVRTTTPSKTVLCVDYLPDRVTEDAVAKVFMPHVKVRNVQLGASETSSHNHELHLT